MNAMLQTRTRPSTGVGLSLSEMLRLNQRVSAVQQLLFPDPRPLVERLGRNFFSSLPRHPGVYLMHDASDAVLYVGKAKDLRQRLGSYRVANPDRMPRRHLRLLRLVERIAWEKCEDESTALRREAQLLLSLKPRFNRAGVWEGPRRFLMWRVRSDGLELAVTETLEEGWNHAGPAGAQMIYLHRALVRLLWCRLYPDKGLAGMPPGWFKGRHGARVILPDNGAQTTLEIPDLLTGLRGGDGAVFAEWLSAPVTPWEKETWEEDLDCVTQNFARLAAAVHPLPHSSPPAA